MIITLYKKIKNVKKNIKINPYVDLSKDSYYGDLFRVELRAPKKNKQYLIIGDHCIIDGRFVFETEEGIITIGNRVHIGGSTFISRSAIIIDDDVTIAWDCLFYDHNSHSTFWSERKNDTEQEYKDICSGLNPIANKNWNIVKSSPIHICSKAWIGVGCMILKGVTIGEGAIVAAGSVVVKDVEPWTMVGGNPAVFIKKIENHEDN